VASVAATGEPKASVKKLLVIPPDDVGTTKKLVDSRAKKYIGKYCGAGTFLNGIGAVIQEFGWIAIDSLLLSAAQPVVNESRTYSWSADSDQLIPRVPCIGGRSVRIDNRREISILIIFVKK
jgi:hypothetical protein